GDVLVDVVMAQALCLLLWSYCSQLLPTGTTQIVYNILIQAPQGKASGRMHPCCRRHTNPKRL
ncbi:hypothetical protein ABTC93_20100, partial [Acinetobacter baumannii]